MLTCHGADGEAHSRDAGLDTCLWFDLCNPSADEIERVEQVIHLRLPTRERIREIEMSSRVRLDGDVLHLNIPFFAQTEDHPPTPLGLIVAPEHLVSIRYGESPAFDLAAESLRAMKSPRDGATMLLALVQALVGQIADHMEADSAATGALSARIFGGPKHSTRTLTALLTDIGRLESGLTRSHQTVAGLARIVGFAQENAPSWLGKPQLVQLKLVHKDLVALGELGGQLTEKLQFLLDAALGFINIEQNDVIKFLTVASVVTLPPMILAGIWGMNFVDMPELKLPYGYPLALTVIALSVVLPLLWFKRRGWL